VAAWYPAAHYPAARPVLALITDVGAVAHKLTQIVKEECMKKRRKSGTVSKAKKSAKSALRKTGSKLKRVAKKTGSKLKRAAKKAAAATGIA
jgi:hypothetical protein